MNRTGRGWRVLWPLGQDVPGVGRVPARGGSPAALPSASGQAWGGFVVKMGYMPMESSGISYQLNS